MLYNLMFYDLLLIKCRTYESVMYFFMVILIVDEGKRTRQNIQEDNLIKL